MVPDPSRLGARTSLVLGASLVALAAASPAFAQANPVGNTAPGASAPVTADASAQAQAANPDTAASTDTSQAGNEIVVTAQFRAQNLQDTPLAITAVNAQTMEAKSQTNLAQVADSAPNVSLKPQGASFGPSVAVSIRGIGGADFNPAFESGVGIYIDDVYYPQLTGAVFDLLDLDRVEILRGPQGTLSGRNSEGGSIKMFTKKPTGSNEGFVEGTYGSRNRIGLRAGFDFKLTDDLFGRISGVYKHQNGYVKQYDFGCLYPAGGPATFTANDGTTKQTNPAGGIPAVKSAGSCVVDKLGEIGYQALRGALRYNPSSAVDINVTGEYIHDKHSAAGEVLAATDRIDNPNTNIGTNPPQYAGGFPGVPYDNRFICGKFCNFSSYSSPAINYIGLLTPGGLAGPGQPLRATQNSNESIYDAYNLAANAHFALSDTFSIDNILAYQHWKTQFGVDDDLSPIPLSGGFNSLTHWNWSEELRLNVKLTDTIHAVLGGYYFKQETDYFSYQDLRYINAAPGLGLFPLQFIQPDRTPAQAKAAFANVDWEIVPGLTFDGGLRYTEEAKQYHYFRYNPDGVTINPYVDPVGAVAGAGAPGALTGLVARYKGNRWDYRAALNYRFSPEAMIYVSTSTGFKGGGTNPRPFFASQAIAFAPEVLTNYEVGLKTDLFDRRLRFDIDAFYAKLKNAQVGVSLCPVANPLEQTPCAATINGGNAREWGVEAEFTARPVDGLSIDGSASYLNFKYTSLVAGTTVALGDPLAGSPKWKWTLGAQYEADLGRAGWLTPRVDASYQDKIYTGFKYNGTPQYIGSYTLLNARLTWQNPDKDLSVSLEGTNLTNKYYYVTLFDLRAAGAGLDKAQPGRPREWAVTVKKTFGGASAPPPVSVAAPVAPAMQTCADGSQVLATQACPLPPPPAPVAPPPPPAAAPVGERG